MLKDPFDSLELPSGILSDLPNKQEDHEEEYGRATGRDPHRKSKTLIEPVVLEEMIHSKIDSIEDTKHGGHRNSKGYEKPDSQALQIIRPAPIGFLPFHGHRPDWYVSVPRPPLGNNPI